MKLLTLAFVLSLLASRTFAAPPESVPGDLSAALQRAKVGTTLRVEAGSGPVVGRYRGIERGGLQLRTERENASIPLESVAEVSELKSKRKTGVLWGVVIGLGAGLLVASQADEATVTNEEDDWLTDTYYAAVGGLLGGAIGGVVGSAFNSWERVYP